MHYFTLVFNIERAEFVWHDSFSTASPRGVVVLLCSAVFWLVLWVALVRKVGKGLLMSAGEIYRSIYIYIYLISMQGLWVLQISGLIHSLIKLVLTSPAWPMNLGVGLMSPWGAIIGTVNNGEQMVFMPHLRPGSCRAGNIGFFRVVYLWIGRDDHSKHQKK